MDGVCGATATAWVALETVGTALSTVLVTTPVAVLTGEAGTAGAAFATVLAMAAAVVTTDEVETTGAVGTGGVVAGSELPMPAA